MGTFLGLSNFLPVGRSPSELIAERVFCYPALYQNISCSLKIIKILQGPGRLLFIYFLFIFWSRNEVALDSYNWSLISSQPLKFKTLPFIGMKSRKSPKTVKTLYLMKSVHVKSFVSISVQYSVKSKSNTARNRNH